MSDVMSEFTRRLMGEWLPTFCTDPERRVPVAGFQSKSIERIAPVDAADFMRALDGGVILDTGGGRYRAPLSSALEYLFWSGSKTESPRPLTLWAEPLITMACLARLHFEHAWPRASLGMQSTTWEYDLVARREGEDRDYLVGEVKKTVGEVDRMVECMLALCAGADEETFRSHPAKNNARKKWAGFSQYRPKVFWAIGPGGHSRVFRLSYSADRRAKMEDAGGEEALRYPPKADRAVTAEVTRA